MDGIDESEWRIVLIGKTGVGKSATGNSILGSKVFESRGFGRSVTKKCHIGRAERFGKKLLLVDTPGFFDTGMEEGDVVKEITKCVAITSPGIHAVIWVNPIGRFTDEDKKTADLFFSHFNENIIDFLILVFTRKDDLDRDNSTVEEFVDTPEMSSMLRKIIEKCKSRYIAFDNTAREEHNDQQVKGLFTVIEDLLRENGSKFYIDETYCEMEKAIRQTIDEEELNSIEDERETALAFFAGVKAKIENERRNREPHSDAIDKKLTTLIQVLSKCEELKSMKNQKEGNDEILQEIEKRKDEEVIIKRSGESSKKSKCYAENTHEEDNHLEKLYLLEKREKLRDLFQKAGFKFMKNLGKMLVEIAFFILLKKFGMNKLRL